MVIIRRFCSLNHLPALILLTASLFIYAANVSANFVASPGSTTVISIDPVLPRQGEPFTINITGEWRDSCIPSQSELSYEIGGFGSSAYPGLSGKSFRIKTTLDRTTNCSSEYSPTPYQLSVPVQNLDVSVIYVTLDISDPRDPDTHNWHQRVFDLVLGLHTIPPYLGSGNWLSEETPSQGLLIQQQGTTVVFHEFTYNRISGEPNWLYATGKFQGNSLTGIAYLVNWLSPSATATPGFRGPPAAIEPYIQLAQPLRQDLDFAASSAGIDVLGVNHIRAFAGLHEVDGKSQKVYHNYKRWVFALDDVHLPPVVPDMSGLWDLYGFDGQSLEQSHQIEFRAGTKLGDDLYRFSSLDDSWQLNCQISLDGEGDCTLINTSLGLSFNYYLHKDSHDGRLDGRFRYFNGNYAKAPLVNLNRNEPEQAGILLRSGVHLPVLDLQ